MARKTSKKASAPSSPEAGGAAPEAVNATVAAGTPAAAEGSQAPEAKVDSAHAVAEPKAQEHEKAADKSEPESEIDPVKHEESAVAVAPEKDEPEFATQTWRITNNSPSRLSIAGIGVPANSSLDVEIKSERRLKRIQSVINQLNEMTLAGMNIKRYSFEKV